MKFITIAQRIQQTLERILSVSSLLILFALVGVVFAALGADVFLRVYTNIRQLVAVGASVFVMVFGSLLILSSRKWSIVTSLNDIPKMYVPINQIDLHKPVHKLVHGELNRVNDILAERKPLSEDMTELGWGPLDDPIHYKSAVIQTSGLLEEAAARLSPYFIRQPHMTFRRYLEYLVSIQVIEREEIARYYIDRYEYARFCDAELSTAEYKEAMKLFALLLRELKFPVNYH